IILQYDASDNLNLLMNGSVAPYVRFYRQGEVAIRIGANMDDSTRKLAVVDNVLSQDRDRVAGYFLNQVQYRTSTQSHISWGGWFNTISTKDNIANNLVNVGLYVSANRADSNYAAIFDSGFVQMKRLPVGAVNDSSVV